MTSSQLPRVRPDAGLRRHILVLSHATPFPPDSGCTSRTLNMLKQLRADFDITLVSFSRRNHQRTAQARKSARRELTALGFTAGEPVALPGEHSLVRRAMDHLRGAVGSRPYTTYQYRSQAFAAQLDRALASRAPDIVHLEAVDLHDWLPHLPDVPVTCMHHDIESDHLRQRAATMGSRVLAWHVRRQAQRVERLERTLCPRFALNIVCSESDARRLATLAPGSRIAVAPNGVDTGYFAPAGESAAPDRVVFVGPTYTYPNRDAVDHFLDEIWPRILERRPGATLHLVGGGPNEVTERHSRARSVTVLGKVPDIRPSLAAAACVVVPIRYGGGTRIKILDAWAMGKAIVSTSRGAEGLDARDGVNLIMRDEPREFASAVCRVLEDSALRARLGREGRTTATRRYCWDVIGAELRAAFHSLPGPARVLGAEERGGAPVNC